MSRLEWPSRHVVTESKDIISQIALKYGQGLDYSIIFPKNSEASNILHESYRELVSFGSFFCRFKVITKINRVLDLIIF